MPTPLLPQYVEISKYANHIDEENRRELWPEMVDRVCGMHRERYSENLTRLEPRLKFAERMLREKRALGSQRALQFGGAPVFQHNARVYNCTVSFCDRIRFFQECFFLLLCGCGTGFSVQRHHVGKIAPMTAARRGVETYTIPDTIEGWADSLGVLLSSFFTGDVPFPEYQGVKVIFDPSQVRPKGSPISSGSKAPGPEPLIRALKAAEKVLLQAQAEQDFRPIHAYDIMMHASEAVLAGGVRRSASIALFSVDDEEMAKAKTGNWYEDNPQRARSNNSAVLVRDEVTMGDFMGLLEHTKAWGDPGFYFTDSTEQVPNPCVEIGMWPVWVQDDGTEVTGWEMCNLSTINGRACTTPKDFFDACRAAATLGTLQAGYTRFPYLGEVTEKIVEQEALIGVSITGMMDSPDLLFDEEILRRGAQIVKNVNEEIAEVIGINPAARTTCLKPEGSTSCVLDTASGIHPYHSRRGIRHVQASVMEETFQWFREHNPHMIKQLPETSANRESTMVIAFPYEVHEEALTKAEVSAMDLLQKVILVRRAWVETGTRPDRCVQPWLRHNVSNTVHVEDHEWDQVAEFIFENRQHFAGVALLGSFGDKMHNQAPFVSVHTPEEQVAKYGAPAVNRARELAALLLLGQTRFPSPWEACQAAERDQDQADLPSRLWVETMRGLADDHFDGDVITAGIAVKDAWLWTHWLELRQNSVDVDWESLRFDEDTVHHGGESACAGGSCEVIYV